MPTVPAGSKVLVTGANGFVAAWVIRTLLEKGYKVRGTIRSEGKGVHLKKIFADHGDKFELIIVEDITKLAADDPQGNPRFSLQRILLAYQKPIQSASTLKRFILLSSTAAVISLLPDPKPFTESDWNEQSIEDVKVNGKNANQVNKYCASKTLAEKAAWELYNANKAKLSWDLVVLNPPYIFGPIIHEVSSPAALNTSSGDWYNSVVRPDMGGKPLDQIALVGNAWIDIRDVALAHVLALQKEKAGGERLIILEGDFSYQDFIDAANALSPSPIPSHTDMPKGNPGAGKILKPIFPYDASKAPKLLGPELVYHTKEETTRDTLADFERRGW